MSFGRESPSIEQGTPNRRSAGRAFSMLVNRINDCKSRRPRHRALNFCGSEILVRYSAVQIQSHCFQKIFSRKTRNSTSVVPTRRPLFQAQSSGMLGQISDRRFQIVESSSYLTDCGRSLCAESFLIIDKAFSDYIVRFGTAVGMSDFDKLPVFIRTLFVS